MGHRQSLGLHCRPIAASKSTSMFDRKSGYCNCATGVSDDEESSGSATPSLVSLKLGARDRSHAIKIGWMEGRGRLLLGAGWSNRGGLLSVAYNDECDVVVALATFGNGDPAHDRTSVVRLPQSTPMVLWAKKELGLDSCGASGESLEGDALRLSRVLICGWLGTETGSEEMRRCRFADRLGGAGFCSDQEQRKGRQS